MATNAPVGEPQHGPWNPGLESTIPEELRPMCTLLRPENVFTTMAEARELHSFTGLDYADLVVFRASRLALHEVLIRVSADLSVPDGLRVEDLGINFRAMTRRILARLETRMAQIEALHESTRKEIARVVADQMANLADENASARVAAWEAAEAQPGSPAATAAYGALARLVSSIRVRHGRLWGPRDVMAAVATGMACNEAASQRIGERLEPWFLEAATAEAFRLLPPQERPVVMNTKGASASGKSTIRLLQRGLAKEIGTDWEEFALLSPDIWRKQLLDYGSLGPAYKYAGPLTGEELRIVDHKLDEYMAAKARRGRMPHLLIDRFRFDSFAKHSDEAGSNLLTRFGRVIYLFFMVTAPASLVERAWRRGLDVGRYKSVDDTLAHAVEAYSGMPQLFFTWVLREDKRVHFEFLDNEVPAGERPRTAAFGWNDVLNVLDVGPLLDVERFRHVDIDARGPEQLFRDAAVLAPARNAAFLGECVRRFPRVDFADARTGRIYLRVAAGSPSWVDRPLLRQALADADTRAFLEAALPAALAETVADAPQPTFIAAIDRTHTLGAWLRQSSREGPAIDADGR